MLVGVFLISNFWLIEIIVYDNNFLYCNKDIDCLSSNLKRYFKYCSGGLKIAKLAKFWTK